MTVRRHYVDGRYGQLHVRTAGAADAARPPVLCLHQSPKSGRLFADVLPHLGRQRLAIAPDYPGMGESDVPPAIPPVGIAEYAASMLEALDAFTAAPCHVVGHHTGAMVAAELAAAHPRRVLSVTSISAPVLTDEEAAALDAAFQPIPIDEAGTRYTTMWQRVLDNRGPGMTLAHCAESFAENLRGGEHYEWGHRAAFAYARTYTARLRQIEQPVLVINVKDDLWDVTPRADALLTRGERRDYPDWGHGFLSAFPVEAASEILDFITRHDPA